MTWDELEESTGGYGQANLAGYRIKVGGIWYLIGDINCLAGTCDDCRAFPREAEIEEIKKPEFTALDRIEVKGDEHERDATKSSSTTEG